MAKKLLLGLDIGTTGAKAVLFDLNGNVISKGYVEYGVITPQPKWNEQKPEIWWSSISKSVEGAVKKAKISPDDIVCVGLSSQTNGVVCVDNKGSLLRPCIIWMDRRATEETKIIREKIGAQKFHETTGVLVDPFYSISKILWIKNNEQKIFNKTATFLQPKDYIGFKLTGQKVMDVAMASCTGMLDTRKKKYAEKILEVLDIPIDKLPELVNPTKIVGELTKEASQELGFPKHIPVVAGSGDVMVNAVGSGVIEAGQAYAKTATVSDIVASSSKPIFDKKFRFATYIHPSLQQWLSVGGATGGGLCYRWFRDVFGQLERGIAGNLGTNSYEIMNKEAELAEPGCNGLIFLPYIAGARSPIWDPKARGVYFGMTLTHRKSHFIRSILEGVAYSMRHRVDIMENELGVSIAEMRLVGGGGRSSIWRRIMADVCGKPMLVTQGEEHEALGAAILAGVGAKIYRDIDEGVNKMVSITDKSEPDMDIYTKYEKFYKIFVDIYDKLKDSLHQL